MIKLNLYSLVRGLSAALILSCGVMPAAQAAFVQYTYSFSGGTDSDPGTAGNTITYDDDGSQAGVTVTATVTAWTDLLGDGVLSDSVVYEGSDGLAVCNSAENNYDCEASKNHNSTDNAGEWDFVMIQFSQPINLDSFNVTPDGDKGRDVTVYTGSLAQGFDLTGVDLDNLTTTYSMLEFNVDNGMDTAPVIINLYAENGDTHIWGDTIILGASRINGNDRIYITDMTTTVPIPAGVWLLLSGLGALVARARHKRH